MPSPQTEGVAVAGAQTNTADGAANINQAFTQSASMSQEQIFSPLEIRKNYKSSTPGFRSPFTAGNSAGLFAGGSVGPTIKELNPYFSAMFGDDGSDFIDNNDYVVVVNETGGSTTDLNIRKLDNRRGIDTVRTVGLRGPLILSGWGFDIADRPVPAKGTSGTEQFEFDPNLVGNRAFWKTGPVNLMWDDERQVWAGGPQIVCGELVGTIAPAGGIHAPTTFTVKILRASGSVAGQGSGLPSIINLTDGLQETITVTNRDMALQYPSVPPDPDDPPDPNIKIFVMAIRLNYEWLPLWVGCEPLEEEPDNN